MGRVGAGQGPAGHHLAGVDGAPQVACADHGGCDEVVVHVLAVARPGLNEVHLGRVQVIRGLPCNKRQHSSHRKPGLPPGHVDIQSRHSSQAGSWGTQVPFNCWGVCLKRL